MKDKKLHTIQTKLLKLLSDNIDDPLTVRELQEAVGASSTSVVAHHLQALEKKGYLKRNPYNTKDYQVVSSSPESSVAHLNLYGMAQCGPGGSILDGDPIDRMPIAARLLSFSASEAFMVKARGKSMEPKIFDGDLVIARKSNDIENGKIYVVVNDGEALIKRVQLDGKNIILNSINAEFTPFIASKDFRVEGEVKGIFSRKI